MYMVLEESSVVYHRTKPHESPGISSHEVDFFLCWTQRKHSCFARFIIHSVTRHPQLAGATFTAMHSLLTFPFPERDLKGHVAPESESRLQFQTGCLTLFFCSVAI